jgi:hypothetical protein
MAKRTDWAKSRHFCWLCGSTTDLQVHEVARGSARSKAVKEPACWIRCCPECHDLLADYSVWPIVRQCALKLDRDPQHYDLAVVNRLRGRSARAITQKEVDAALATIEPVPVYLVDAFC